MLNTKVYLAPMDGVTDAPMRAILCKHGGYDWCFSEFLRVTDLPLNAKQLISDVPELKYDCRTPDGTPLRVQLLGDNPQALVISARRAIELGALGIDLNLGCPSRFVHHSGAMLLKEPELLHRLAQSLAEEIAGRVPFSLKIRTGFLSKLELPAIIQAIAIEGVDEIIVHCRTRKELYQEQYIDWSVMASLHAQYPHIDFIVNGEINDYSSAQLSMKQSGAQHLMVGRGAMMIPNLGHVLKQQQPAYTNTQLLQVALEILEYFAKMSIEEHIVLARVKQFCGYARRHNPYLTEHFKDFARITDINTIHKYFLHQIALLESNHV